MLIPGLLSITFRPLKVEEIIRLVVEGQLQSIEWGGDIHVPHGDIKRAQEVGRWTREAGLSLSTYGSYYKMASSEKAGLSFERVLESAVALGAPTIRVWPGIKGSADHSPSDRSEVVDDTLRVAELATKAGLTISLEYHVATLTDGRVSVQWLLGQLTHPGVEFFWQATNGEELEPNVARLHDVLHRVRNVHVFHWWPTDRDRQPLAEGESRWRTYINIIRKTGRDTHLSLEYVAGDTPQQFLADAATLRRFLEEPA